MLGTISVNVLNPYEIQPTDTFWKLKDSEESIVNTISLKTVIVFVFSDKLPRKKL